MSSVRTLEIEKVGAPIVVATVVLTFGTIAFLLVREASAPLDIAAPAAVPSYELPEEQVPSALDVARPETPPASPPGVPRAPEDPSPGAREQRVLGSRKALETIDARELLRQASSPK